MPAKQKKTSSEEGDDLNFKKSTLLDLKEFCAKHGIDLPEGKRVTKTDVAGFILARFPEAIFEKRLTVNLEEIEAMSIDDTDHGSSDEEPSDEEGSEEEKPVPKNFVKKRTPKRRTSVAGTETRGVASKVAAVEKQALATAVVELFQRISFKHLPLLLLKTDQSGSLTGGCLLMGLLLRKTSVGKLGPEVLWRNPKAKNPRNAGDNVPEETWEELKEFFKEYLPVQAAGLLLKAYRSSLEDDPERTERAFKTFVGKLIGICVRETLATKEYGLPERTKITRSVVSTIVRGLYPSPPQKASESDKAMINRVAESSGIDVKMSPMKAKAKRAVAA